jgi:lipopolysaccharide biosynthesis glycosyltransferase
MKLLDIFIGFDSNEVVAYYALCQSILSKSSRSVRFAPINLSSLRSVFHRERNQLQSTEFSFSRFLVPYLSEYSGWSLFMDCDMLARADISELFDLIDEKYSVMVCKHDYVPRDEVKFLGNVQTKYEKKNWSSLVLFNNAKCKALTPEYVNTASGLELHQFKWLGDDAQIGGLPLEWNWLVGEYPYNDKAKICHFTLGGPYFRNYVNSDYADEWNAALKEANFANNLK